MSTTRPAPAAPPARSRTRAAIAITAAVVALVVIAFFVFSGFYSDVLWFDQLGFLEVLTTRWAAFAAMFAIGFVAMALIVWLSIALAFRARPVYAKLNSQLDRYQQVIEPLRRVAMIGIPLVLGLFMGVSTATRWETVLQFLNRTPFGTLDPQFNLDVSFYVYELPLYRGILAYASAVVLIAGLAALATAYIYGGIQISGREVRVTRRARIQIAVTAAIYIALQGVSIWFDQYATLTDQKALFTGVSYADDNATIPGRAILAGIAGLVAVLCIVTAIIGRWRLPLIGTALLIVSGLVIGSIYPALVQRLYVEPTAAELEAPYIEKNIQATREAYGVEGYETIPYTAVSTAEQGQLRDDAETTAKHPHHRPDPGLAHVPAARARAAVLHVHRQPGCRPVQHRRGHTGHRHRGARGQPGPGRQLVQQRSRLHARLRRRRRLRQPARRAGSAGVPRVGHPVDRAARRVRAARLLRRELARLLRRRRHDRHRDRLPVVGLGRRRHERDQDHLRRRRRAAAQRPVHAPRLRR